MMETKENMDMHQHVSAAGKPRQLDELQTILKSVAVKGNKTAPPDTETVQGFSQTFNRLFEARKTHPRGSLEVQLIADVEAALQRPSQNFTKKDVQALVAFIYSIDEGRDEEEIANGVTLREARYFAQFPKLIEKWQTKNCVGAAMLLTSILKERGVEAYFANPDGHAVSLVRLHDGTLLYADPSTSVNESKGMYVDVSKGQVSMGSACGISILKLPSTSCTPECYSLVPFHRSIKVGYEHCIKENMDEFIKKKDKATALALETMGDDVEWGLQRKMSEEMLRLQKSDVWKEEQRRTAKANDIEIGFTALRQTLGEEETGTIKSLIADDKDTATFYVHLLTSPPSTVASEFTAALQMKLPSSILVSNFLEAHNAFWTATEGLRGIDPDAFVHAVERSLKI